MDKLFPNRIHRHALVRLLQPRVLPRDFPANWDKRLGEDIQDALARFREAGLGAECSLAVKVEHLLNASVIKQMLRERGLKVSGRKDEGAQRLADADPEGVRRSIDPIHLFSCTPEGRETAERFAADFAEEHRQMEEESVEWLRAKAFRPAVELAHKAELGQPFEHGINIPWGDPDEITRGGEALKRLFHCRWPTLLQPIASEEREHFRFAACMESLWGGKVARFLPAGIVGHPVLSPEVATKMLRFAAHHVEDLENFAFIGAERVKVSAVGADQGGCPECQALAVNEFALDEVPELPHPRCTSPMGCRCFYSVVDWGPARK